MFAWPDRGRSWHGHDLKRSEGSHVYARESIGAGGHGATEFRIMRAGGHLVYAGGRCGTAQPSRCEVDRYGRAGHGEGTMTHPYRPFGRMLIAGVVLLALSGLPARAARAETTSPAAPPPAQPIQGILYAGGSMDGDFYVAGAIDGRRYLL